MAGNRKNKREKEKEDFSGGVKGSGEIAKE